MICIIFTIFSLAIILIIISFAFTFCPLLQLLRCNASNHLVKLLLHLETSRQFWNPLENRPWSGKIRTALKPSRKLAMIWKNLDSFETVQKIDDYLEKSGQFETVRKIDNHLEILDSFETFQKIGNHLENSRSFWKYLDSLTGFFLFSAQKLSGHDKTFRVAMLPCFPGFSASAPLF